MRSFLAARFFHDFLIERIPAFEIMRGDVFADQLQWQIFQLFKSDTRFSYVVPFSCGLLKLCVLETEVSIAT